MGIRPIVTKKFFRVRLQSFNFWLKNPRQNKQVLFKTFYQSTCTVFLLLIQYAYIHQLPTFTNKPTLYHHILITAWNIKATKDKFKQWWKKMHIKSLVKSDFLQESGKIWQYSTWVWCKTTPFDETNCPK